jgi:dienelactone hydrolase
MRIANYIKKQLFEPTSFTTGRHYRQSVNPFHCVLFLHGRGERGPADGSQLALIEKLAGFPKFAKGIRPGESTSRGTIEYDFDIYAPQVVATDLSYKEIMYSIVPWLEKYFGYTKIVIVGISMGGYGAYDILKNYTSRHAVKGVISVAGSAGVGEVQPMVKIPGMAFHGDADPTVKYADHKAFVDAYNAAGGQIEFVTLPGVAHNAWDHAFNADPSKDRALAFVNKMFAAPVSGETSTVNVTAEINLALDKAIAAISALKK